jgi:hypothetical protein
MSDLQHSPAPQPTRRPLALRVLGIVLLLGSVGLVSCQALFSW